MKQPAVYIMANKRNGALYIGVTSNLVQRVYQHREGLIEGFTNTYGCKMLVYYDVGASMEGAILREKQLKGRSRKYKLKLIETVNPQWKDLYDIICPPERIPNKIPPVAPGSPRASRSRWQQPFVF